MGEAPERGLDPARHHRHALEQPAHRVGVDHGGAVGAQTGLAAGAVVVLAARLAGGGEVVEHRIDVAGADPGEEARPAHHQEVLVALRLGDEAGAEAGVDQGAADQGDAEGGMVDVGVAVDQQHIQLVPAPPFTHLGARHRQGDLGDQAAHAGTLGPGIVAEPVAGSGLDRQAGAGDEVEAGVDGAAGLAPGAAVKTPGTRDVAAQIAAVDADPAQRRVAGE